MPDHSYLKPEPPLQRVLYGVCIVMGDQREAPYYITVDLLDALKRINDARRKNFKAVLKGALTND
jgi:hypothetical protein